MTTKKTRLQQDAQRKVLTDPEFAAALDTMRRPKRGWVQKLNDDDLLDLFRAVNYETRWRALSTEEKTGSGRQRDLFLTVSRFGKRVRWRSSLVALQDEIKEVIASRLLEAEQEIHTALDRQVLLGEIQDPDGEEEARYWCQRFGVTNDQ